MARSERFALLAIVLFFAAAYSLYGLFRHWHFGSSAFDMGIFDQVVWHLSRFETPASSVREIRNFLGDHFFPIVALFAPLYWISPGPATLIVAQAAIFAASIVPVFLFARRRLPRGPALAIAVAFGCFWGIQRAMAFDVHEVSFATLAVATAILAMDRRDWRLFWIAIAAMLLTKEDMIPLAGMLGIYLIVIEGERRRGAVLIGVSAAALVMVVGILVPLFNEAGTYGYASAYSDVLARPGLIPITLVTPPTKVATAVLWFVPFAFLSLASPLALLAIPFALTRFLSVSPNHWGTVFHYSAPLAPIVAMSAADGLAKIAARLRSQHHDAAARRAITGVAVASVILSAFVPGRQPLWRVFAPSHYRGATTAAIGDSVVAMVPADASVVAQGAIVPHLSMRNDIHVLTADAPDADFVVTAEELDPWPLSRRDEVTTLLEERRARGYSVVFAQGGWTLLRRSR